MGSRSRRRGFCLLSWTRNRPATGLAPSDYDASRGNQGGMDMVWIAGGAVSLILVILVIIGLVDLFRSRATMEPWQVVVWALLIVFVPFVGLITYLFWRIFRSEAMRDALSVPME